MPWASPDAFPLEEIERIIGYRFRNRALLATAFTHHSRTREKRFSSERLEWLGDRVLNMILADKVETASGMNANPQMLNAAHAALNNNRVLAGAIRRLGLDEAVEANEDARQAEKTMGDVFEALLAAMYRDSGSWETVTGFLEYAMADELRLLRPPILDRFQAAKGREFGEERAARAAIEAQKRRKR